MVLASVACKNKEKAVQEEKEQASVAVSVTNGDEYPERLQTDQASPEIKNLGIIKNPEFVPNLEQRPVNMESVVIEGDSLIISVNFSGGCKDHSFYLTHTGAYMESMPPILDIFLEHEDNGDACRGLMTKRLGFDLSQLRYSNAGTLTLRLAHYREPLTYVY